jgi:catechol 2,3-dioxygenase-like lactoylglutathione lyase family enzyme
VGVDHIQLAMPAGQEHTARHFYVEVLGLTEIRKPVHLAARGGAWFENADVKIHLGVDPDFRPARKAHPGLLVTNLQGADAGAPQRGTRSCGR